jgi:signal transduction histidine kinase/DNA-binding response OmpR family regulator
MLTPEKQFLALENAFDGIALLNKEGQYIYMNKSHAQLFGYQDGSELLGKSWKHIYNKDYASIIENQVFPLLEKNGNWSGESIGLSKDKKPILQHITLNKLPDGGLLCLCRDNSKAINANRLQYLISNLGKGILVEDENHEVVLVNQQFCDLFKIPLLPEQMIGVNCLEALQDAIKLFKDPEEARNQVMSMLGKQEPVIGYEVYFADGRVLERDYVPIIIEDTFKGQLWSYIDVTQQRHLQRSLVDAKNRAIRSEKSKSAFLSSMSHEIRTPMSAVIGLADQLSMTELTEQQSFFVKNITDSANGLLGVINDILDMAKIEAGKMNIERDVIVLSDIIKSVENILKPKAEEKGIQLKSLIDSKIDQHLFGDAVRIRQILMNILGNAIKFTDAGSIQFIVTLLKDKESEQILQFICQDSGIGISEDSLDHIFDEFHQENNSNTNHSSGSGLGLSITKKLVNMMDGKIELKSTKGFGTKVTVEIPFPKVEAKDLASDFVEEDLSSLLIGKRILIVEDNKINRVIFSLMLNNLKVLVDEAENGLDALELIDKNQYDLILMDIQMPVMDGPATLVNIRRKFGDSLPVIALTAAAFKSEVIHMLNLGFSDCITKPIDQKGLQQRLGLFFKSGSHREKYYKEIHKLILAKISEMAGDNPVQLKKMVHYLIEEVDIALVEWEKCLLDNNWTQAKRILHREKMMIKSIGIDGLDGIIAEIEDHSIVKTNNEMVLMFTQLIQLFKNIKERFDKII